MRVSVVVCTYNRAESVVETLEALTLQRFGDFEVVVVNGPSTDATAEVLAGYGDRLKVLDNPLANLSASRNIGIRAAAGDVVAFIDDDAVPDPAWLEQLVAGFDDDEVAGVGGVVLDHTGLRLQYGYSAATRFGEPQFSDTCPYDNFCVPGAAAFPYLQGTNAAFRREVLGRIGLFDEHFDFYLDETDLCCRLVDAGYVLRQLPGAPVQHMVLASDRRNAARAVTNWTSVMRNHVYFGYRHGLLGGTPDDVQASAERFLDSILTDARYHEQRKHVEPGHVEATLAVCRAAMEDGHRLGREEAADPIRPAALPANDFRPYPTRERCDAPARLVVVEPGLDARAVDALFAAARAASDEGGDVRVVAPGEPEAGRVRRDGALWVHELEPACAADADRTPLPWTLERFHRGVVAELERIDEWWEPGVVVTFARGGLRSEPIGSWLESCADRSAPRR